MDDVQRNLNALAVANGNESSGENHQDQRQQQQQQQQVANHQASSDEEEEYPWWDEYCDNLSPPYPVIGDEVNLSEDSQSEGTASGEEEEAYEPYAPIDLRARVNGGPSVMERLVAALDHPFELRDAQTSLRQRVNFKLDDEEEGLERVVAENSSWVLLSPEQTDKTFAIATLVGCASLAACPSVVIVKDMYASAKDLAENKLGNYLSGFNLGGHQISAQFLGGGKRDWKTFATPAHKNSFKSGNICLVLPGYTSAMACLQAFLEDCGARNVVLILDEADDMWGTKPFPGTIREQQMYKILGADVNQDDTMTLAALQRSCARSFVHISATHISTMMWHYVFKIPYKRLIADKDTLVERGYLLHEDLDPVQPYLEGRIARDNLHGLDTPQAIALLKEFAAMKQDDARRLGAEQKTHWDRIVEKHGSKMLRPPKGKRKLGKWARMMQICLSPRIYADGSNNFDLGRFVLQHVEDAVVLIRTGRGTFLMHESIQDTPNESLPILQKRDGDKDVRLDMGASIKWADENFGLARPIVVLGYACLKRCISVRSNHRVITHAILHMSSGQASTNLEQMFMRAAGMTKHLRVLNGFPDTVKLLCRKNDYDVILNLYRFTEIALDASGTGDVANVDAFLSNSYPPELAALIWAARPLARRGAFNPSVHNMRLDGVTPVNPRARSKQSLFTILVSAQHPEVMVLEEDVQKPLQVVEESGFALLEVKGYFDEAVQRLEVDESKVLLRTRMFVIPLVADFFTGGIVSAFMKDVDDGITLSELKSNWAKKASLHNEIKAWCRNHDVLRNAMEEGAADTSVSATSIDNLLTEANPAAGYGWWRKGLRFIFVKDRGCVIIAKTAKPSADTLADHEYVLFHEVLGTGSGVQSICKIAVSVKKSIAVDEVGRDSEAARAARSRLNENAATPQTAESAPDSVLQGAVTSPPVLQRGAMESWRQ